LNPIKINVVAMRGVNDDEVLDFARLTYRKPYHMRFIELMPIGEANARVKEDFVSSDEVLRQIRSLGTVRLVHSGPLEGPASMYALEGAKGRIGVIAALSHHFCETCNRLRLTADGHLRGCLFSDRETDLKTPLREGKEDDYLLNLIRDAILMKPKDHGLELNKLRKCARLIPLADVVAITGTALTNHTIEYLLALCRPAAFVILLGDTAPLSPVLFEYSVDAVSGTKVINTDLALKCVSEGANFRQIKGTKRLTLLK